MPRFRATAVFWNLTHKVNPQFLFSTRAHQVAPADMSSMNNKGCISRTHESERDKIGLGERGWITLLYLVCLVVIFSDLGGTALFEPDEGRNAEKAREILLLGDWVTPYGNFVTTLDKPMFLYWFVALSFKIFGISEWSARLPSALAALGTMFLVYRFARLHLGLWEALWSCLILVTSFEYFFWQEHFFRFATPDFGRNKSWYYFFVVIGAGFAPWSPLLLFTIKDQWKRGFNDANLFLVLWAALPFIFFSLSNAKLPQYILSIFPALAILTGQTIAIRFSGPANKEKWILYIPWSVTLALILYFLLGSAWPQLLPNEIRLAVSQQLAAVAIYGAIISGIYGSYLFGMRKGIWRNAGAAYLCACIGIALFLLLSGQIVKAASFHRTAKTLAAESAPLIASDDQIVFYATYLEGVPFYLRIDRPIWLVETRRRAEPMTNSYLGMHRMVPAPGIRASRVFP